MSVISPRGPGLLRCNRDLWLIYITWCELSSPVHECARWNTFILTCVRCPSALDTGGKKSNLVWFSSSNFISLICSHCFKMCKIMFLSRHSQSKYNFSSRLNMLPVIPTNNQLQLWSDYSGISSTGSNGLDLHVIAKWGEIAALRLIYPGFTRPVWQLYCLKNSKKGGFCKIPPCRGSLSCSPPSRLHQCQWWERLSPPHRQHWAI